MPRDVTPLACAVALVGSMAAGALAPEVNWRAQAVTPPPRPARIVSLALPADEILLALVDPSRVLALDEFADDRRASNVVREASAVPRRMRQPIVAEAILEAEPDLVILPAWSDRQLGALLALEGVPVHRVGSPSSLADIRAEIRALANVVGERARGEALIAEMDARLEAVRARARERRSRPTILLAAWSGQTPSRGTVFCDVVELVGARCAAAEAGYDGYALVTVEDLLVLDPDLIVTNAYRADSRAREVVPEPPISEDPRYRMLTAVRTGRVIDVPTRHLLATSHHVAALAEDLSRALDAAEGP